MSSPSRTLARHVGIYGAGLLISKAISFVMLPVYTRYLTPAAYGTLELLEMTIDVIGTIAGAGLAAAVFKFYFATDDRRERHTVVGTAAAAQSAFAAGASLLGAIFAPAITTLVLGPEQDPLYFRLFFLILFLQSSAIIPRHLMRALNQSGRFVTLSTAQLLIALSANIYFVVFRGMGVKGVLLGTLIAKAAALAYLLPYLLRRVGLHFSRPALRRLVRFGYPVVFWSLGTFVLTFADRYFLKQYGSTADVGLYALGYKFAFILGVLVMQPFMLVWQPQRFDLARREDAPRLFGRVFFQFNVALVIVALGIVLLAKDTIRIMADQAFWPSYAVVPVLIVAQVLVAWTRFADVGMYLANRTRDLAWSSGIAVVAVLALNFALIPRFGIDGAAWATVGASGIGFLATLLMAQRAYRIEYPWGRLVRLYAVAGLAYGARELVAPGSVTMSVVASLAFGLFAAALIVVLVLDGGERLALAGVFRRLLPTGRTTGPAA